MCFNATIVFDALAQVLAFLDERDAYLIREMHNLFGLSLP